MTWQLTITGLLIGALVGLTGMGAGSLMTPILILAFGFKPALAVGTDILHGAVFKTFGAVRHRRLGTVHARMGTGNVDLGAMGWLLLGSIPGVLIASKFTVRVPDGALRVGLGTVLLASGIRLLEFPGYAGSSRLF